MNRKLLPAILIIILIPIQVSAAEIQIEPDPYWIQTGSISGALSVEKLTEASLAASGLSGAELQKYMEEYSRLREKFTEYFRGSSEGMSVYDKGDLVLQWMHSNVLSGYIEEQTLMNVILDTGKYNCVSSSILYLILTESVGIPAGVIETTDHAFCVVETEEGAVDVETTTSYGFHPGIKKEFQSSFDKTGFSYVPPGNYRQRKSLNDREAVALILQNRISMLQKRGMHMETVPLAVNRWALTGNSVSLNDMNNVFRNWAAVLNSRREYLEAGDFIIAVSEKYNLKEENSDILYNLANNHIIELINNREFDTARTYTEGLKDLISARDFSRLYSMTAKEILVDEIKTGDYSNSVKLVRAARDEGTISTAEWGQWITYLHQTEASGIAENSGWWDSWQFLKNLPEEERKITALRQAEQMARDNWSFSIHNRFAELFNNGDYDLAEEILVSALEKDPENRYFIQDLKDMKKRLEN